MRYILSKNIDFIKCFGKIRVECSCRLQFRERKIFYPDFWRGIDGITGVPLNILEAIMLVCFGAAWPFSLYKSYKSRTVAGKSVVFLYVIFFGYVAGWFHKFIYDLDFVIYLYTLNGFMVLLDIALYYRNKAMDSRQ